MAKNYMAEVAKMLGVELEEEFKIEFDNGILSNNKYILLDKGMVYCDGAFVSASCVWRIINGEYKVVKLPWKPKFKEAYYYPCTYEQQIFYSSWVGSTLDYAMYNLGMCYKTKEEAEAHFAEDYKKLTGKELKE